MKIRNKSVPFLVILILLLITTSSCTKANDKFDYYSNEENYIEVTGTIDHVVFDDENQTLYLEFSNLSKSLDDNCFKIVGDNYSIIVENFKEHIKVGESATFVTAPKYFGDGYVMPIVSFSLNDTCLLEYENGILNFLAYLKNS